jgi:hypothetical protein
MARVTLRDLQKNNIPTKREEERRSISSSLFVGTFKTCRSLSLGLQVSDRLFPNNRRLIIMVVQTDAFSILPANFSRQ